MADSISFRIRGTPFAPMRLLASLRAHVRSLLLPVGLAVCCLAVQPATGGKLDTFEEGVTRKQPARHHHSDDDLATSCLSDIFSELFLEIAYVSVGYGGVCSWYRSSGYASDELPVTPRDLGEAVIPFVRADVAYQNVDSDVSALDYRLEAGFGPLGVSFRQTHYTEDTPADNLDLLSGYFLYRMSLLDGLEIDMGFGAMAIAGHSSSSAFSVTLPVSWHPSDWLGFEFRPAWADINDNPVRDLDAALLVGWRYVSLKGGYRWVEGPSGSLNGPYVGVSFSL